MEGTFIPAGGKKKTCLGERKEKPAKRKMSAGRG